MKIVTAKAIKLGLQHTEKVYNNEKICSGAHGRMPHGRNFVPRLSRASETTVS